MSGGQAGDWEGLSLVSQEKLTRQPNSLSSSRSFKYLLSRRPCRLRTPDLGQGEAKDA